MEVRQAGELGGPHRAILLLQIVGPVLGADAVHGGLELRDVQVLLVPLCLPALGDRIHDALATEVVRLGTELVLCGDGGECAGQSAKPTFAIAQPAAP